MDKCSHDNIPFYIYMYNTEMNCHDVSKTNMYSAKKKYFIVPFTEKHKFDKHIF